MNKTNSSGTTEAPQQKKILYQNQQKEDQDLEAKKQSKQTKRIKKTQPQISTELKRKLSQTSASPINLDQIQKNDSNMSKQTDSNKQRLSNPELPSPPKSGKMTRPNSTLGGKQQSKTDKQRTKSRPTSSSDQKMLPPVPTSSSKNAPAATIASGSSLTGQKRQNSTKTNTQTDQRSSLVSGTSETKHKVKEKRKDTEHKQQNQQLQSQTKSSETQQLAKKKKQKRPDTSSSKLDVKVDENATSEGHGLTPAVQQNIKKVKTQHDASQSNRQGSTSATKQKQTLLPINLIKNSQSNQNIWNATKKFQGITQSSRNTEVCHFTFKVIKFPDETKFRTKNKESCSQKDILPFYDLVYCVDCEIPVYWMCLGENTQVQNVTIDEKKYLVFQCDKCYYSKSCVTKPKCRECHNEKGYMQKMSLVQKDSQPEFVHPICALSFPNIYQMSSPANMSIKFCSGIEMNEIGKILEPNQVCDICQANTPRMLKCKDYDKLKKSAHAFCILNMNKKIVYETDVCQQYEIEDKVEVKWNLQMFFVDTFNSDKSCFDKLASTNESQYGPGAEGGAVTAITNKNDREKILYSQSPFMRVLCNEQRNQQTFCHCENNAADKENITQCQSCHIWYHQDCWGDHVDIQEGGPSTEYLKQYQEQNSKKQIKPIQKAELNENDNSDEEMVNEQSSQKNDQQSENSEEQEAEQEENKSMEDSKMDDVFSFEKQEDFLLCSKCIKMSKLLNYQEEQGIAQILLQQKTIDDLLPQMSDNWSTAVNFPDLPACDFRSMETVELSIFEHILLYKFWYKLIEQSLKKKLNEELYKDLLERNQVHLINNQTLENQILKKLREKQKIKDEIKSYKFQSFFFKEIFGLRETDKLIVENIQYNLAEKTRLQEFMNDKLKNHQIITNDTIMYYKKLEEAQAFESIAEIYSQKEYVEAKLVQTLIQQLRESPSFDHTQSFSFRKLDHDYSIYIIWQTKYNQLTLDSECKYKTPKITQKISKFKWITKDAKQLSQLRYDFLKNLFSNKLSIEQAEKAVEEAQQLFVQNTDEINELKNSINLAKMLGEEVLNTMSNLKPVKAVMEQIANIAQICVKPANINQILTIFKNSQELRIQVKSFITDKIDENLIWIFEIFQQGLDRIDVMKKNKAKGRALRDRYPHYVFSIEKTEELFKQISDPEFLIDDSLKSKFVTKYNEIKKIRDYEFAFIKEQYSTPEEIEQFVNKINNYENIDFDYEKQIAMNKISVVRIGQKFLDGTLSSQIQNISNLQIKDAQTNQQQKQSKPDQNKAITSRGITKDQNNLIQDINNFNSILKECRNKSGKNNEEHKEQVQQSFGNRKEEFQNKSIGRNAVDQGDLIDVINSMENVGKKGVQKYKQNFK